MISLNDEIKELLNQLEIVARKHTIEVCEDDSKIETMPASVVDELRLNNYSARLLLDYITNLQKEVRINNDLIPYFKNKEKSFKKQITNLQEENKRAFELLQQLHYLFADGDSIHERIEDIQKVLKGNDDK